MAQRCAVVGVGQTKYDRCRADVSIGGLVREAVDRALADAEIEMDDIDAIVIGKAPDMLEGVVMPELWLADALAASGKPVFRVHTAGTVGGSTAIVAAQHVMGGRPRHGAHDRVREAERRQRDVGAQRGAPVRHAGPRRRRRLLRAARAHVHRPEPRRPVHIGAMVAVKDRTNALDNPYAHLHEPDWTLEKALESPMLWDPIRFVETCPSSDGAIALVLCPRSAPTRCPDRRPGCTARRCAASRRCSPAARRSARWPARCAPPTCSRKAGITDPFDEIDVAEIYVPFSWFEPMWLENLGFAPKGDGWRLVDDGVTDLDGALPVNPSGGVLSTNPIGATGMIRFGEAALQVMGKAGAHQVDGARRGLGHAYGGGSQFFAMWVVGSDKP